MNVLSRDEQVAVLHQLVEGSSLRSVTRLTGIHRTTIMKLMLKAGDAIREFLNARMLNLELNHLECDEIWTFVRKKQGRLKPEENDDEIGDQGRFVLGPSGKGDRESRHNDCCGKGAHWDLLLEG